MSRLISRHKAAQQLDVDHQTVSNWVSHEVVTGLVAERFPKAVREGVEHDFDTLSDSAFMGRSPPMPGGV
jgi:hypothetical protein